MIILSARMVRAVLKIIKNIFKKGKAEYMEFRNGWIPKKLMDKKERFLESRINNQNEEKELRIY